MEAFGGPASGGCLGGVLLGFAEIGDGFDEPGKAGHERELGQDGIAAGDAARAMRRAARRRSFPAGDGRGMRP